MITLYKMSNVTYERECRCKKNKGNGRKRQSWRTGNRGESAKATESPSDCTFPWPVSKSTLQAFSISAPYFSFLLIYRFIVQQPFWRSLNLTHPPPVFHPPTASRSFLYPAALHPRSHLRSTRNDARSPAKSNPSSRSTTDPQVFGKEISIQAIARRFWTPAISFWRVNEHLAWTNDFSI